MPWPSLWEVLLDTRCFVWQLQQMRVSVQKREGGGAHSEQRCSSTGLFLHSDGTLFLCQHGTREALNMTFRDAQRFSPEAWGREKRTNDAFADTCFKCQEGGFAREFWPQRSGENSRTSVLAPVRGLRLSFVWNGLISFWSDMIF